MRTLRISFSILFIITLVSCKSYNSVMVKKVKKSLGKQFKGYSSFTYPTSNFGVMTSYTDKAEDGNYYCGMNTCLDIKLSSNEILNMGGLLDVGSGGPITLSESDKKVVSLDAVLPQLWKTLNVEGEYSSDKVTTVTMSLGAGHVRQLNRIRLKEALAKLSDDHPYKIAFNNGKFAVVVSDVVVESMSFDVKFDNNTTGKIEAALSKVPADSTNATLNFGYERTLNGEYKFKVTHPVIVMRLIKKQPNAGALSGTNDFSDWLTIKENNDIDEVTVLNIPL